ncbi:methyltransferase-like protein [Pyrenochaeta sp. MPI-SDFR-AT-0127]|nr:methyltransferase-like protein [Pyrenochaeta sp. MPI-SDFR-AT-0127]
MAQKEWEGDFDPMADPEEQKHLLSVLDSFRSYRRLAHYNGTHVRRQAFYSLPQEHWMLLTKPPFSVLDSFSKLDDLIDGNAELAEAIFIAGFKAFIAPTVDSEWVASIVPEKHAHNEYQIYSIVMDHMHVQPSQTDVDKVRSCVNQFYREWSGEGAAERTKCFDPVIAVLNNEFASKSAASAELDRSELRVLVPGAGLGRLVFDICRAGFSVEGNEISYHELMASSLILNHTEKAGQFKLAPFALNCSNHISRTDQFQTFSIPDVHPGAVLASVGQSQVPGHERMSMSTGDFCVLYTQPEYSNAFNAVATVFFIDTAPNIIRYIEAVRNCLAPGGVWVNLGPLLWHHVSRKASDGDESDEHRTTRGEHIDAGIGDPGSVELTHEEVLALVEHLGFTMEKHECGNIVTGYISNPHSMLQNTYRPSFWVARKK